MEAPILPASWIKDIVLPWQEEPNPHLKNVMEKVKDFMKEFGLLNDENGSEKLEEVIRLGAHFYPDCGKEELIFGSLLALWFFFFDDIFDESDTSIAECNETITRTCLILNYGNHPAYVDPRFTPVEKLILKVREMAVELTRNSSSTLERFLQDLLDYVEKGIMPMALQQKEKTLPSLKDYMALRVLNAGVYPVVSGHEVVSHLNLPCCFFSDPRIKEMRDITTLVVLLCNDVFSYNREIRHKNYANSLYIRAQGKDFASAFAEEVNEIQLLAARFTKLKEEFQRNQKEGWDKRSFEIYCKGMENAMDGVKLWSETTIRYGMQAKM